MVLITLQLSTIELFMTIRVEMLNNVVNSYATKLTTHMGNNPAPEYMKTLNMDHIT